MVSVVVLALVILTVDKRPSPPSPAPRVTWPKLPLPVFALSVLSLSLPPFTHTLLVRASKALADFYSFFGDYPCSYGFSPFTCAGEMGIISGIYSRQKN